MECWDLEITDTYFPRKMMNELVRQSCGIDHWGAESEEDWYVITCFTDSV